MKLKQALCCVDGVERIHCMHKLATYLYLCWIHLGLVELESPREIHYDVFWVVSTPRSPVPASLHLIALELKLSLLGLRASEHPLFTPSILVCIQGTQGIRA